MDFNKILLIIFIVGVLVFVITTLSRERKLIRAALDLNNPDVDDLDGDLIGYAQPPGRLEPMPDPTDRGPKVTIEFDSILHAAELNNAMKAGNYAAAITEFLDQLRGWEKYGIPAHYRHEPVTAESMVELIRERFRECLVEHEAMPRD